VKRALILVAVLLAGAFVAIFLARQGREPAQTPSEHASNLTEDEKNQIRRFWSVYNEAARLQREGRWQDAARGYRLALEIDPDHLDALYYLGNASFELGQYEEAVGAWRRLTEANPLSGRAYLQLGAIHSCGAPGAPFDLDIAQASFERALEINKEHTGPVLKLGEVHLLKGDDAAARSYFGKVLQTNPASIEANYLQGYLAWRAGNGEAARSGLQAAITASVKKKPSPSASGEGETRGKGPMLAAGAGRTSLFAPAVAALASWPEEQVSLEETETEYNGLHRRVRDLVGNG
jgi:tetratricopeptide (TPR) repeat protein